VSTSLCRDDAVLDGGVDHLGYGDGSAGLRTLGGALIGRLRGRRRRGRLVDPHGGGQRRRSWGPVREALGVLGPGVAQDGRACFSPTLCEAVVQVVRREHPDPAVAVLPVVPLEKRAAMGARVFQRAEALGEVRPILEGLELRLGEGIIVGDAGARMGLGDAKEPRRN
jgi:hypothetical protein